MRIVARLGKVEEKHARSLLGDAKWHLPTALVAAKWGLDAPAARSHLSKKGSRVGRAMSEPPG